MISGRLHNPYSLFLPSMAVAVVIAAVIAALILVGSPMQERRRRADELRVQNMQSMVEQMNLYYAKYQRLPERLDQLNTIYPRFHPETEAARAAYAYHVIGPEEYELCATFETDTSKGSDAASSRSSYWIYDEKLPFWKHSAGYQCFRLKVEKPPKGASVTP